LEAENVNLQLHGGVMHGAATGLEKIHERSPDVKQSAVPLATDMWQLRSLNLHTG
jgi:hypothetical protein